MSSKAELLYNRFSFLYPVADIFLKPQKNALVNEINRLPEGDLLEIGVGNGSHLGKYTKHRITGIDTSTSMLSAARKQTSANIRLLKMDGTAMLFESESFDYVVLSHVIAVVDDVEKLIEEVLRVLKPGGMVYILNHFTPNNWLRYIDAAFAVPAKLLRFKSVFHIQEIAGMQKFRILKEVSFGAFSYFKLLVYQKAET